MKWTTVVLAGATLPLAVLPASAMGPNPKQLQSDVQNSIDVQARYWAPYGWIPIALPLGQKIGDVIDMSTRHRVASLSTCFGRQTVPTRNADSSLPSVDLQGDPGFKVALGAPQIGNLDIEGNFSKEIKLSLTEASGETVDEGLGTAGSGTLRAAYDEAKCPQIKDLVMGQPAAGAAAANVKPVQGPVAFKYFVIGGIITAKRQITLTAKNGVNVKVAADGLAAKLVSAIGNASFDVKPVSGTKTVTLTETKALPVAAQPAFLPYADYSGGALARHRVYWLPPKPQDLKTALPKLINEYTSGH